MLTQPPDAHTAPAPPTDPSFPGAGKGAGKGVRCPPKSLPWRFLGEKLWGLWTSLTTDAGFPNLCLAVGSEVPLRIPSYQRLFSPRSSS